LFGVEQEKDFDRLPILNESTAKFLAAEQRNSSKRFESAKKREANFVIGASSFD